MIENKSKFWKYLCSLKINNASINQMQIVHRFDLNVIKTYMRK